MTRPASSRIERHPPKELQKPRLLVVDDDSQARLLIDHLLRDRYSVDGAADAEAALVRAEETSYDGFLIDITLQAKRNGIDVLQDLRAQPRYREAPMIAVTAHALPGDRERFLAAGFDAYLSKPFTRTDLYGVIESRIAQPRPGARRRVDQWISQKARPAKA